MKSRLLTAALLAALAVLPLAAGEYWVNLASQVLIAVIFASSLNLLVGYGGLTSLGHAAYLGFAAYVVATLTTRYGFGQGAGAAVALLATAAMGGVFGWIALRASGLSFLMLTLALSQVIWGLAYRWSAMTGGDNGISGLARPAMPGVDLERTDAFYWFALLVAALVLWTLSRVVRSPWGATLRGTKDQPRRMAALGYDVRAIRWSAFVAASVLAGIAGLLHAWFHKYVHPSVLSVTASAEVLLSVISGGAGTLAGPAIGALLVVMMKNYASNFVERWNMLLGAVFVLIVVFMPQGIVPGVRDWLQRRARRQA